MSRIYSNFRDAINEIRRDLSELSVEIKSARWQGRDTSEDPGFNTKELSNYLYTVTNPKLEDLNPTQPWADSEFEERMYSMDNPGQAWKLRPEVWQELFNDEGRFDYTYGQRISDQPSEVVSALQGNLNSRQIFMSIWDPCTDPYRYDKQRVPCSLGYYFQYRGGGLNITYLQRSCDFVTHYENDVYLATRMLHWISEESDLPVGMFSHWIGSFHVFSKDVEGVF